MNAAPSVAAKAQPLIDFDLHCVGCDYNLRMQPRDGRCPECATPVVNSLNAFVLDGADPAWCRDTARGLRVLSWVFIAQVVLMILSTVQHLVAAFWGNQAYFMAWLVSALLQFVVDIAFVVVICHITRPEPQAPCLSRSPRLTARIAALIFIGMATLSTLVMTWLLLVHGFKDPFWGNTVRDSITTIAWIIGGYGSSLSKPIAQLAVLALLWRWLGRGQRTGYRRVVNVLFWMLLLATIITLATGLVLTLSSPMRSPVPIWFAMILYTRFALSLIKLAVFIMLIIAVRATATTMLPATNTVQDINESV